MLTVRLTKVDTLMLLNKNLKLFTEDEHQVKSDAEIINSFRQSMQQPLNNKIIGTEILFTCITHVPAKLSN